MRGQLRSESETKLAFWPLGLMPDHGLSCCKYDFRATTGVTSTETSVVGFLSDWGPRVCNWAEGACANDVRGYCVSGMKRKTAISITPYTMVSTYTLLAVKACNTGDDSTQSHQRHPTPAITKPAVRMPRDGMDWKKMR